MAHNPGTEGSKGVIPAHCRAMPHPAARLVRFGADFVFCARRHSPELVARVLEGRRARGWPVELLEVRPDHQGGAYAAAWSHADPDAEFWEREARVAVARFMVVQAPTDASAGTGMPCPAKR